MVAGATFVALVAIFLLARGALRGFVGDAVVVVFLDAALAVVGVGPLASPRVRIVLVAASSMGVEALQTLRLVGPGSHWLLHAVLGSTFDPLDLIAYGLGTVAAALLEARVYAPWRSADP